MVVVVVNLQFEGFNVTSTSSASPSLLGVFEIIQIWHENEDENDFFLIDDRPGLVIVDYQSFNVVGGNELFWVILYVQEIITDDDFFLNCMIRSSITFNIFNGMR